VAVMEARVVTAPAPLLHVILILLLRMFASVFSPPGTSQCHRLPADDSSSGLFMCPWPEKEPLASAYCDLRDVRVEIEPAASRRQMGVHRDGRHSMAD
jgi:hypothetical protein